MNNRSVSSIPTDSESPLQKLEVGFTLLLFEEIGDPVLLQIVTDESLGLARQQRHGAHTVAHAELGHMLALPGQFPQGVIAQARAAAASFDETTPIAGV